MPIIGVPPDFCKAEDLGAFWFELLHPDCHAVPVPVDQLDPIQPAIEKHEHVAGADVAAEFRLHDGVEPVEALPHVGRPGVEVDPGLPQGRQQRGGKHGSDSPFYVLTTTSWNAPLRRLPVVAKTLGQATDHRQALGRHPHLHAGFPAETHQAPSPAVIRCGRRRSPPQWHGSLEACRGRGRPQSFRPIIEGVRRNSLLSAETRHRKPACTVPRKPRLPRPPLLCVP